MLASWWPLDQKEMDLVVIWGSRVVPLRLASLSGTSSKGKYFVYLNYFLQISIIYPGNLMCDIDYSNFRMCNLFVILVLVLAFQGQKQFVNASSRDLDADLHEGPGNNFSNFLYTSKYQITCRT